MIYGTENNIENCYTSMGVSSEMSQVSLRCCYRRGTHYSRKSGQALNGLAALLFLSPPTTNYSNTKVVSSSPIDSFSGYFKKLTDCFTKESQPVVTRNLSGVLEDIRPLTASTASVLCKRYCTVGKSDEVLSFVKKVLNGMYDLCQIRVGVCLNKEDDNERTL